MQHPLNRAFSLVETLVIVSLLIVVGLALQSAIVYFYKANAYILESSSAINEARRGMTYVVSNIREATYGDDGAYPVENVATSSITFYADVDLDGGVEKTRIYVADNTLYRSVTNAIANPPTYNGQPEETTILAVNLRNGDRPLFRYFDANGTELTGVVDASDVASIAMDLMIDLNPTRAPEVYMLTGSATLRNFLTQ